MGPERLDPNNFDWYDIRSDVWSLGLTLVELATGKYPFAGSEFEMMSKIIHGEPPRLRMVCLVQHWSETHFSYFQSDGFSPEFCDIVERCLQKDPTNRPNYDELLVSLYLERLEILSKMFAGAPIHQVSRDRGYRRGGVVRRSDGREHLVIQCLVQTNRSSLYRTNYELIPVSSIKYRVSFLYPSFFLWVITLTSKIVKWYEC